MDDSVRIFKALSDPTRLRIVRLLLRRDLCVCELMDILDMEQSRLSHHLRLLRDAGLVEDTREGRWIIYRISEVRREALEAILESVRGASGEAAETRRRDLRDLERCLGKVDRAKQRLI